MSDGTKISWSDATWNPVTGCTQVSPGCAHCYALTLTERWHGKDSFANVTLQPKRLEQPFHWRKPRRVFVNSMSDLFHEAVPDEYLDRIFAVMVLAPHHTYQILTKRIERAYTYLSDCRIHRLGSNAISDATDSFDLWPDESERGYTQTGEWPPQNILLGPTVENLHFAYERLPYTQKLHEMGWRTMVSYEPALGPVDFGNYLDGIDWLICGGESGAKRRPFDHEWAQSALQQASDAGVPFFMKQDGAYRSEVYDTLPDDLKVRQFP